MKIKKLVNELLISCDIYQMKPFLLINRKKQLSSRFSQFLSILFFIYLSYNLYLQFQIRVNFQSQTITNLDVFLENNSTLSIDSNYMMAFRFEDLKLQANFNKYFQM
jgi:hypothetical protein